jgi:hypothetical protein
MPGCCAVGVCWANADNPLASTSAIAMQARRFTNLKSMRTSVARFIYKYTNRRAMCFFYSGRPMPESPFMTFAACLELFSKK